MSRKASLLVLLFAIGAYFVDTVWFGDRVDARGRHAPVSEDPAGAFDYYLISLSWSPTFCKTHPDETDQCGEKGYGFVLHGLWPQYQRGGGPERCASEDKPDRRTVNRTLAFMPSRGLINHEWLAHGTCSGLAADAYFALADRAFASVHVPPELATPASPPQMSEDDIRNAFIHANPGLRNDEIALHCSGGELAEVRICADKDLSPRACGARMQSRCPDGNLRIPVSR